MERAARGDSGEPEQRAGARAQISATEFDEFFGESFLDRLRALAKECASQVRAVGTAPSRAATMHDSDRSKE